MLWDLGTVELSVHAAVRITLSHEKWPTQGRPSPKAQRYTQAQRTIQPPDDRTYSAEVTAIRRNLPHHRSARAVFPHTRSDIIPPQSEIVKKNFRKNHKLCPSFSYNLRAASGRRQCVKNTGDHRYTIGPARYRCLVGYFLLINRMSLPRQSA